MQIPKHAQKVIVTGELVIAVRDIEAVARRNHHCIRLFE